jgi:hypothetical protein
MGPRGLVASYLHPRLAAAGMPVSRRALRSNGIKGSNEALNALAHGQQRDGWGRRQVLGLADATCVLDDRGLTAAIGGTY